MIQKSAPLQILGVDTGGTFTDFVFYDGQQLRIHKQLSTPHAPEQAILAGIKALGLNDQTLTIVHGSTVATNAALEGKGVRTAFITNHGLGDMLSIGRQARRQLYALNPPLVAPPVSRELCLETGGRLDANGNTIEALSADDLAQLKQQLQQLKPRAVAINLLFSFLDDRAERAIAEIVPEGIFVSRSSQILPEYKEYERGIATWLNAWVGPLVQDYLRRLCDALPAAHISVMQSSGGTIAAELAGAHAVHMLLSGPAGGLAAARFIGESAGQQKLLTFDMGGTSTDVAMIDGALRLTNEGRIGPYPVAVPMVDMHTIGAGGGSIAWLDDGGMLQVGPESAGAKPGPACYGQGGTRATVTDANLVLGRLQSDAFLGGRMQLDLAAARRAVATLATPLGLSIEETAVGIIRLADEHMAQALRVISIERGHDPKQFSLMPFGGAGGLHVCALAEALGVSQAIIPIHGGVLSALGMLVAPRSRELSRAIVKPLQQCDEHELQNALLQLQQQAHQALQQEGVNSTDLSDHYSLDLRYQGQAYHLNIDWPRDTSLDEAERAFARAHTQRYGHQLQRPVEIVNLRCHSATRQLNIQLPPAHEETTITENSASLYGIEQTVRVIHRATLAAQTKLTGPCLIVEPVATSYIAAGWQGEVDRIGNILLSQQS